MSSSDDEPKIFRNKNRNIQKKIEKYEPEYVRLGMKPEPFFVNEAKRQSMLINSKQNGAVVNNTNETVNDYSSINGDVYDDFGKKIDFSNNEIIDNNDFVFPNSSTSVTTNINKSENNIHTNEYILMIFDKVVLSGDKLLIESKIKSVIYGEDSEFAGKEVSPDDIVVLKKVNIKIGVFLDE